MAYLPPNAGRMNVALGGNTAGAMATVSTGTLGIHGGNNVTLSQNGNNVTISGANALTSQSNQAFSAGGGSSAFQTLSFSNGNGVSFTNTNGQVGASVATTYAASNHSHGNPTLNLTNLSGTTASASNGLTLSLSAAAPGAGAAISAAGASASNGTVVFSNSNGIGFGMNGSTVTASHNGLTSQSNQAFSAGGGSSAFQTLSFSNGNGVTFTNTNGQVGATIATNYAASNHSHGNPTLALTNLSGTTASASNGLTLSLSAAAPGAGGGVALYDGANSITSGTARISAGGAMTASVNGQTLSLNVPVTSSLSATGAASISVNGNTISIGAAPNFSAGGASANLASVVFSNSNGVSFGLNGSTITASAAGGGGASPAQRWKELMIRPTLTNMTNITAINGTAIFQPFYVDGLMTLSRLNWEMSRSTSGSNLFTVHAGIYSYVNDTQISLVGSASGSFSNTATASVSGVRRFGINGFDVSTFNPGGYVLGMLFTAANTASMNYSLRGGNTATPQLGAINEGADNYNTATSYNIFPFWGRYTAASAAMPSSVGDSQVRGQFTGASQALGWWVGLNND